MFTSPGLGDHRYHPRRGPRLGKGAAPQKGLGRETVEFGKIDKSKALNNQPFCISLRKGRKAYGECFSSSQRWIITIPRPRLAPKVSSTTWRSIPASSTLHRLRRFHRSCSSSLPTSARSSTCRIATSTSLRLWTWTRRELLRVSPRLLQLSRASPRDSLRDPWLSLSSATSPRVEAREGSATKRESLTTSSGWDRTISYMESNNQK